jgi:zinc finger BED domain-containing protein 5/7/8/9
VIREGAAKKEKKKKKKEKKKKRESLASKAMSPELKEVFDQVIKIVNFVKSRPLNSRIFRQLCAEMGEEHENLLLHSEVRWLSRGKVLNRLFELRDPLRIFLSSKNSDLTAHLEDVNWVATLAYLADIFEHLNTLNTSMQGPQTNLISLCDKVSGFMAKLEIWQRRIAAGTIDNLPLLKAFLQLPETVDVNRDGLLVLVLNHLQALSDKFKFYFGDLDVRMHVWVCDPFIVNVDELHLSVTEIDQMIDLSHNTVNKAKHKSVTLVEFWIQMKSEYPDLFDKALRILLPFATSYLCESGFSALTTIKTKHRARLSVEDDLRLCLSRLSPRYDKLCDETQAQGSH